MDRLHSQSKYWDLIANQYDNRYGYDTVSGKQKIQNRANILIKASGINSMSNVLEVGCGTGVLTTEIAKYKGINLKALDCSSEMIQIAKNKMSINPDLWGVDFSIGDIHHLEFKDGLFDAVVGNYVLMYTKLDIALKEMKRVLKIGGRITFIELNAFNPLAFILTRTPIKYIFHKSKEAMSFFPQTVLYEMQKAGFKSFRVEWLLGSLLIVGEK
jgi:ubiquinone/menaquinone biosynthesis C-methylase UbiE